jgi:hypothetical protein
MICIRKLRKEKQKQDPGRGSFRIYETVDGTWRLRVKSGAGFTIRDRMTFGG